MDQRKQVYARIAQLVERQTENLCVGGSIPSPGTKLIDTVDIFCYYNSQAQVAKLVDAPDLGSGVEICVGSSPTLGTIFANKKTYRGKTPVALRSDAYLLVQLSG